MKIQVQHNYPEECNITPVIAFTTEPWKGIYIGWIYWCLIIYFTEPVFYEPNKAKAWYKSEKINLKQKIDRLQGYVDEYSHENENMKIHIKLLEKTAQAEIDKLKIKIKNLILEKDKGK